MNYNRSLILAEIPNGKWQINVLQRLVLNIISTGTRLTTDVYCSLHLMINRIITWFRLLCFVILWLSMDSLHMLQRIIVCFSRIFHFAAHENIIFGAHEVK